MTKSDKLMHRVFTIAKVVLCVYPFAALFYMTSSANLYGLANSEILKANPVLTITFLTAMLQPLAAWLLTIIERRVDAQEDGCALLSLLLLFIAECMFKNWVGIVACGLLFYMVVKQMPESFKDAIRLTDWRLFFKDFTGYVLLIALAAFCLFASMQIA